MAGWRWGAMVVMVLAGLAVAMTGCTDQRTPEQMKDALIYAYADQFKTFDPARQVYAQESSIINQVLEPLLFWDNDMILQPLLATEWSTPDACRSWVFTLRKGVKFHDDTPFNAAAVKFHFDRILDPATASARGSLIADVERIEVIDDLTVTFHLSTPNCIFPERLAGTFGCIVSPTAIAKYGPQFRENPVGTGPFRFVEWIPDVRIVLERNEAYWNRANYHLRRLEFWPVHENTTRLIYLEQGVVDMADVAFAHVNVAAHNDRVVLQTTPQLSIRYIGLNTKKPPFDDVRVRQAANWALNKEDLVKYMFFGVGEPAKGPFPSVLPDYKPDLMVYGYDPERARELMAEAGYPDGVDVVFWSRESGDYRLISDAAVEALRQVGIRAEVKLFDSGAYWSKFDEFVTRDGRRYPTKEGVFDIYVGGWVGGEAAHGFLEPLFKPDSYSNDSFFDHPRVNELLAQYKFMESPEERRAAFHEMQEIIVEQAPWIFGFHGQVNVAHGRRVRGFRVNASGRLFFEGVRVVDDEDDGEALAK